MLGCWIVRLVRLLIGWWIARLVARLVVWPVEILVSCLLGLSWLVEVGPRLVVSSVEI